MRTRIGHFNRILIALSILTVASAVAPRYPLNLHPQPKLGHCSSDIPCQNYGSCNINSGVCSCPLGFSGPMCEIMLWPACRITLEKSPIDLPPSQRCYSDSGPKSCECLRQCKVQPSAAEYREYVSCFERPGLPPNEQLSSFPEETDSFLTYWGSAFATSHLRKVISREELLGARSPRFQDHAKPLSQCLNNCSWNGLCGQHGECRCFYGHGGPDCDEPQQDACFNDCSGRGRCIRGYCSCETGWWGLDCSIDLNETAGWPDLTIFPTPKEAEGLQPYSKPYPPELKAMRARPNTPKIFVYELPSWLNLASETDMSRNAGEYNVLDRGIYSAYVYMLEQLLRDLGGARTLNPWEANIFYVPTLPYGVTQNGAPGGHFSERAARYVQAVWPFWDRFGGADHVFFAVQDQAECAYHYPTGRLPDFLRRAIWLVHWGADHAIKPYRRERKEEEFYPLRCFEEEHFIVVPPGLLKIGDTAAETYKAGESASLEKDTLFFFAGNIDFNWLAYSLGVRQRLYIETRDRPAFDFNALSMRCIPVVIMDDVRQPFEGMVPYSEFALRVSQDDIDNIEEVLRGVPPREVKRLLEGAAKWHNTFYWNPGGLAYNTTIRALQARAQNVLGAF